MWSSTCYQKGMHKKTENEGISTYPVVVRPERGTGPGSAGQSGDTQGLREVAEAGSESVEELVEEGQYVEATLIDEMESDTDEFHEVRTRQTPPDGAKKRPRP